jgi:uncharacterized protein (DUF362 family)
MLSSARVVAVERVSDPVYPRRPPFNPHIAFPEYRGVVGTERNVAYEGVRAALHLLGLDAGRFGTEAWNPLGELIRPGDLVVLKPNLVKEVHPRDPEGWRYVLTHGAVVRAVADYVFVALGGRGTAVIADAPQSDSSFDAMMDLLGLRELQRYYEARGSRLELIDLRREQWLNRGEVIVERRRLDGDPRGYVAYDLSGASEFVDHPGAGRYYGADYDAVQVNLHHTGGRHEYCISGSVMAADVVITLPKLKTHKKTGITVTLKNLVGINGDKNWLPHHTEGDVESGGDERPQVSLRSRAERRIVRLARTASLRLPVLGTWTHRLARRAGKRLFGSTDDVVRSGNWWGNDTTWRMCLDLNKILLYGNTDGTMRSPKADQRRRHLAIVDGIIAGEGAGPMNPDPVSAGLVVAGLSAAHVDAACAFLMGFDPLKIPALRNAFACRGFPLADAAWSDTELVSNQSAWNGRLDSLLNDTMLHFRPHPAWVGHIELLDSDLRRHG